jgi:hypothetical protein
MPKKTAPSFKTLEKKKTMKNQQPKKPLLKLKSRA